LIALLKALRPRQWVKNVLLLAGLYFPDAYGEKPLAFDQASLYRAIAGFFIFCALAGTVYLVNDLVDAPRDRLHPKKKHRPIASGQLSPVAAVLAALILGPAALYFSFELSLAFGLCAFAYLGMEILYSLALKEIFLIDTLIISMGFILRAVSGIIVLRTEHQNVPLTPWFVICVLFLALLLAFSKRRAELTAHEGRATHQRRVLRYYTIEVLDTGIAVSATASILAYSLYAVESAKPWHMLATLPFVIFGIFRYVYLMHTRGGGEAPEEILLHDPTMLGAILLWAVALLFVFYPLA
jgi:4-hydroxybenzoate polyprenyltransferase